MKNHASILLKTLHVLFWIVFIGLCIKAGTFLFAFLVSVLFNIFRPENLYVGIDLSPLFQFNTVHYGVVVAEIMLVSGIKAYIAYLVVMIFQTLDLENPFSRNISLLIRRISLSSVAGAAVTLLAEIHGKWLETQQMVVPLEWGTSEFLFFGGIIYLIALIFERGVALQQENELTV